MVSPRQTERLTVCSDDDLFTRFQLTLADPNPIPPATYNAALSTIHPHTSIPHAYQTHDGLIELVFHEQRGRTGLKSKKGVKHGTDVSEIGKTET